LPGAPAASAAAQPMTATTAATPAMTSAAHAQPASTAAHAPATATPAAVAAPASAASTPAAAAAPAPETAAAGTARPTGVLVSEANKAASASADQISFDLHRQDSSVSLADAAEGVSILPVQASSSAGQVEVDEG
jgi:hypothetical protein